MRVQFSRNYAVSNSPPRPPPLKIAYLLCHSLMWVNHNLVVDINEANVDSNAISMISEYKILTNVFRFTIATEYGGAHAVSAW